MSDLNLLDSDALAEACGLVKQSERDALVTEVTKILEHHTTRENLEKELSVKNQRDASTALRKELSRVLKVVLAFRPEFARAISQDGPPLPLETELAKTIARLDAIIDGLPKKAPTKTEDVALKAALVGVARVFQEKSRWKPSPNLPQYRARLIEFINATGLMPDASDLSEFYPGKKKGDKGRPKNAVLLRRLKRMITSELLQPGPPVRRIRQRTGGTVA